MSSIPQVVDGVVGALLRTRFTFVPPERLLSRFNGGFLLAYHNLPVDRFVEQVESYAGLNILPLPEMVARIRSQRSTAGCLAITVDDGVASTVRALSQVAVDRQWPITFYLPTQYLDEPLSPIHMLWTREEDFIGTTYRACFRSRQYSSPRAPMI